MPILLGSITWLLALSLAQAAEDVGYAKAFGWRQSAPLAQPRPEALIYVQGGRYVADKYWAMHWFISDHVCRVAAGSATSGVDYGRLTALLIEAVKQQQREISGLRTQLRKRAAKEPALESRLERLEKSSGSTRVFDPGI